MITMDIFNNDAFSVTSQIRSIEKKPYIPTGLDALVGFEPVPVSTDTVYVELKQGQINLIRTTLRGAPIEMGKPDSKNIRSFMLPRIAKGDQLMIHELANLRPFDGEGEVETVAARVDKMQNQLIADVEYTFEYHRLGALNGIVYDADGTSEIFNFYTAFGISPPSVIDLDLYNGSPTMGDLRTAVEELIVTPIEDAAQAGNAPNFAIRALCGHTFFNRLVNHPEIRQTYLNWSAAADLRNMPRYEVFPFAGVDWVRYRGTNQVGITSNQAKIFPTGVPGMFQHIMGPCNEMEETINQMGRRYYPIIERDPSAKKQWVQPEIYSYPGFMNLRPDLVLVAQA